MYRFLVLVFVIWASNSIAETVRLAVTTSFENSGLSHFLIPKIKAETGIALQILVVGTGQALKLGQAGDVDAVLVHSRKDEEVWVELGHGPYRRELMYNDYVLIGGAGIIKKELTDSKKIINSHPAYLPYVRGLDSMKWSILNDKPLGVTSHIISQEADQGWLIKRSIVPLFAWDTFHSVAIRQYEMEMDLLASAVLDIPNASMKTLKKDNVDVYRRMPNKLQKQMVEYFPEYLKKQLLIQSH